ncbi:MAG: hypothetical protein H0V81_09230 [Solirubrobacterales bacterium]|nr:hypothetical protein [Solirubrobacterales bacterium]
MLRRLIIAAFAAALLGVLGGCGDKKEDRSVVITDPLAEALAHAPADAAVLAVVDTARRRGASASLARLLAGGLTGGVIGTDTGSGDRAPGGPLTTGNVVVWSPRTGLRGRFSARVVADGERLGEQLARREDAGALERVGEDGDYTLYIDEAGGAVARRGPVFVTGPGPDALRTVLERRRRRQAQWTPALLRERTLGLPLGAIARVSVDAGAELARTGAAAGRLPWVGALQRVAVTITPEVRALRVRVRASVAEGLPADAFPLAPGAEPPRIRGAGTAVASVREPRQTLGFLRRAIDLLDPERLADLRTAEALVDRFANVSLQEDLIDRLAGSATVTSTDGRTVTLRSELDDPERTAGALGRLSTLATIGGPLAGLVGIDTGGLDVDEDDGVYTLTQDRELLVRLTVVDDLLVASNDPRADLKAAARAPVRSAPALGAFRATLDPAFLAQGLPQLGLPRADPGLLASFGAAVLTARAEADGLDAQLILPVR